MLSDGDGDTQQRGYRHGITLRRVMSLVYSIFSMILTNLVQGLPRVSMNPFEFASGGEITHDCCPNQLRHPSMNTSLPDQWSISRPSSSTLVWVELRRPLDNLEDMHHFLTLIPRTSPTSPVLGIRLCFSPLFQRLFHEKRHNTPY